ncbi:MAG: pyridoxal phosphate-dependent aminotransferase [Pseudomonadota bacterium]
MTISKKTQASIEKSSWIRKMFEEGASRKAKFGTENVFDFSLGNPNLEPPLKFRETVRALLDDPTPGRHGYMPNAGFVQTRQAVADYLNGHHPQTFSADDIVMTVGAGGGLNVVLKTILDPGDEVIIPAPFFVEYNAYIDNHQGASRVVDTEPDFSLDLEKIREAVTERTKAVLINSPNNPTGNIYTEEELRGLGQMLTDASAKLGRPLYLISDEPYKKIAYDGVTVPSVFSVYGESFVVTSFSKDLSLAGERIGYVALSPDALDRKLLAAGLVLSNRSLGFVNAPALAQRAVAVLLNESVDVSIYQRKRDTLCDGLASFGVEVVKPKGAFYLFPKTPIEDDVAFVNALQEENILTVPGSGFMGPGHIRIAYCVDDRTIEKSLPGFERVFKKYAG